MYLQESGAHQTQLDSLLHHALLPLRRWVRGKLHCLVVSVYQDPSVTCLWLSWADILWWVLWGNNTVGWEIFICYILCWLIFVLEASKMTIDILIIAHRIFSLVKFHYCMWSMKVFYWKNILIYGQEYIRKNIQLRVLLYKQRLRELGHKSVTSSW